MISSSVQSPTCVERESPWLWVMGWPSYNLRCLLFVFPCLSLSVRPLSPSPRHVRASGPSPSLCPCVPLTLSLSAFSSVLRSPLSRFLSPRTCSSLSLSLCVRPSLSLRARFSHVIRASPSLLSLPASLCVCRSCSSPPCVPLSLFSLPVPSSPTHRVSLFRSLSARPFFSPRLFSTVRPLSLSPRCVCRVPLSLCVPLPLPPSVRFSTPTTHALRVFVFVFVVVFVFVFVFVVVVVLVFVFVFVLVRSCVFPRLRPRPPPCVSASVRPRVRMSVSMCLCQSLPCRCREGERSQASFHTVCRERGQVNKTSHSILLEKTALSCRDLNRTVLMV